MRLKELRLVVAQARIERFPSRSQLRQARGIVDQLDMQLARRTILRGGMRCISHLIELVSSSRSRRGWNAYSDIGLTPFGARGSTVNSIFGILLCLLCKPLSLYAPANPSFAQ